MMGPYIPGPRCTAFADTSGRELGWKWSRSDYKEREQPKPQLNCRVRVYVEQETEFSYTDSPKDAQFLYRVFYYVWENIPHF